MSHGSESRDSLLTRIRDKRKRICAYMAATEVRSSRLTNTGIICSGLAALFTAGPAVGGQSLTRFLTQALGTSPEAAPSWRLLCAGATVLSFIATAAIAIYKSQDLAIRLAKAQAANAELEGLETAIEFNTVTIHEAVNLYNKYIEEVPFLAD